MPSRYRLSNGLTVVFEENHAAPVAAFQVWVKVGSADETPAEVGLAHLHEHMLFKGTARRGLGEIARSIEAHGGDINAWTSFDQTAYHVVMASRFAKMGLDVLADALRASAFEAGELSREIEVVCEEIKRSLDMPSRRASKQLFGAAYARHPYGRPVIGFEQNVRAHTRDGVLAFYRSHYTPSNMVLSAVGDFTERELRAWVEELFGGDWGRPRANLPPRAAEPQWSGVRVMLQPEDLKEAHLHLAFQLPGLEHPDTPALDLLAMVAGQGDASRLALEVRRKRALAKDVSAWAWTPCDPGLFAVTLVAEPASTREAFLETAKVLATLTRAEVEPDELTTAKALVEAEAIYQRETVQGVARKLGYYEAAANGLEQEARYYEAIAQVTPAKLREVAERWLRFDTALVTGLVPNGTALTEGQLTETLAHAKSTRAEALPARKLPPDAPIRLAGVQGRGKKGVTVERLASGATVVVREEHEVGLFAIRAAFPGGLRYETPKNNGLTALLSRTFTRGTASMDAEQLSHLVDRLAGGLGAAAGRSTLGLRGEFLSKHFDRAFELFAEVLNAPAFPEAELERERRHLLQDLAAREDRPAAVAFELFAKTLFREHPYRLSTIGEKETLEALTRADLVAYHERYLDPSQLVLTVVGDVDTAAVLARAQEAFGKTRGKAAPPPQVPVEAPPDGPKEIHRPLQRAQTHLVLGFRAARVTDEWKKPLEVLSTILSGQSGRLFLELRDKRSMAYSVSSSVVEGIDPGWFSVYMATSPEKVKAAVEGIRAELTKLTTTLVTPDELTRAKQHLIGSHDIGLQRNAARAAVIALDTCYGLGAERYLAYADELSRLTAEDVQAAARRVIDFEQSALAVVGTESSP